ncbi:MAG: hypothetical protein FJW14_02580 [Acidimicrobiia bacterium]|nr:hypothetical protein [Acidimicrobiia bacterium]
MRILFSTRNFWYTRLFEPVIRELAERGHQVHVLAERGERNLLSRDWNAAMARLAGSHPNISFDWAPLRIENDWIDLRQMIRLGIDHLRFLEPAYAAAPKLAERARVRTPVWVVRLADAPVLRTRAGRRLIKFLLRLAERAVPIDPDLADYIEAHRADVILVTPLVVLGSEQQDVVRIARRIGTPTALCVGSWDHLSSKALVRDQPDRMFVWNETQRQEAVALHRVPAERVIVTGAQCFDIWFGRTPTLDREAFCRKVGLDPSRPFLLWVCSALFEGSPSEAEFVARWIGELRARGNPMLREAGILVRPHPKRKSEWDTVDLGGFANVALWPPRGAAPMDPPTQSDYFDSMYHGAVTVGLNTSALIEAGIVGRAVHTILLPEFYENQEGTLHFHYLLQQGLLRSARDMASHVAQLDASLAGADPGVHHNRAFVEGFVRPRGLDVAATPVFADFVESMASLPIHPRPDPAWVPAVRWALTPLARTTSGTFAEQISRERRRREKRRRTDERRAALEDARAAQKARVADERRLRREAEVRERQERIARERQEALLAKQRKREAKLQQKEERMAQWQREKRRRAFNARLAGFYRRLLRPFSAHQ